MILCLWFWWCLILKISAPRFVCIGLVRFFCGGCLFWVFFHQLLCYLRVHSGSMCSLPALEGSQTLGRSAVLKKDCICGVQWNLMQRLSNSLPGCDVWPGSCWRQWQMCPGSKVTAVKQPGSFSCEKQEENDIVPVWWMWRRQGWSWAELWKHEELTGTAQLGPCESLSSLHRFPAALCKVKWLLANFITIHGENDRVKGIGWSKNKTLWDCLVLRNVLESSSEKALATLR